MLSDPSLRNAAVLFMSSKEKHSLRTVSVEKKQGEEKMEIEEEKMENEEEKQMKKLENFLFGPLYSPPEFGLEEAEKGDADADGLPAFYMDRLGDGTLLAGEAEREEEFTGRSDVVTESTKVKRAAWIDEEEEAAIVDITRVNRLRKLRKVEEESLISGSEYVRRLRAYHAKLNPGTEWAEAAEPESSDQEDYVHRTNEDLVVSGSREKLLPGRLEYTRLVDANARDPSNGIVKSVQFHRNGQLLFTAGLDRRIRFFQIDGRQNAAIQSVFFQDCPIRKARFLPDGSQVIIAGRRKFFYSLDLVKARVDRSGPLVGNEDANLETFEVSPDSSTIAFVGNHGCLLLVSARTKEQIGMLKMNGRANCVAFAGDGRQLLSHGGDGHVYHWDLRKMGCVHKGADEGCLSGTAICASPDGALFAAGSSSGIVNVYRRDDFLGGKKQPLKVIENLNTKVSFLKFNGDAQILAACSRSSKNCSRLVHIPSFTAFSNWPPPNQSLHSPQSVDFSPGGGFMAVATAAGKALLFNLHHYDHA